MKIKKISIIAALCLLTMTGCSENVNTDTSNQPETLGLSDTTEAATASSWQPSVEDQGIAMWLKSYMTNPDYFSDKANYQYYARAIGRDKDYFFDPNMWEVFYNEEIINRNREISGLDIYLVRLNPYKLLETYAENNNCTVDELCQKMSVNKEQLYYNWGYDPASVNYYENHKNNTVTYSVEEQKIFGIYNNESRDAVMSTHMIIYDHNEGTMPYYSSLYDSMYVARRDYLRAYTDGYFYSDFTDDEKNPAFKINGIGIRAVIPLSIMNSFTYAKEEDKNITVMINSSPFAYGCTDKDRLDLEAIYKYIDENQE